MEIEYDRGDYVLRIGADQLLSLRYALGAGVEKLGSDARFFEHPPRMLNVSPEHARSARETYERAKAVSDDLEELMHRPSRWPRVEWPHQGPACGPAGDNCLCLK